MVTDCGSIQWYVLTTGEVQFWMRDDGPYTTEQIIQRMEELGEREPASANPS
jgi:hypothetical protein